MPAGEIAAVIEAYVREQGEVPDDDTLFDQDADLFEFGYVDSVGFVKLVVWLEQTYDVKLTEAYLLDERFNTISGIASIVDGRVAERIR
jgi:acyl carrier protein